MLVMFDRAIDLDAHARKRPPHTLLSFGAPKEQWRRRKDDQTTSTRGQWGRCRQMGVGANR
jgi:hypothetical protein